MTYLSFLVLSVKPKISGGPQLETEHTTCILGAPGYGEKMSKTMEKWGPGPPIKSALKGGWGCFEAALKRGGGGGLGF